MIRELVQIAPPAAQGVGTGLLVLALSGPDGVMGALVATIGSTCFGLFATPSRQRPGQP
jgi:hypothetical protein